MYFSQAGWELGEVWKRIRRIYEKFGCANEWRLATQAEIIGYEQLIETRHPVQIFFLGIGDEADLQIGRILAEATSAEFQGVSENDLADVLEDYIIYF